MEQPPNYSDPGFPNHVCRLNKVIYGLKQASQGWFYHFSSFFLKVGFSAIMPILLSLCSIAPVVFFIFFYMLMIL